MLNHYQTKMKKTLTLLFISFTSLSFAQCTIFDIHPFKLGQTKLDITRTLSSFPEIELYSNEFSTGGNNGMNGWRKYEYLKNDSIYSSMIILKREKTDCVKGRENRIYLSSADDKLYEINIVQEFNANEYNSMYSYYNEVLDIVYPKNKYNNRFNTLNENNEKIGEGVKFYDNPNEKTNKKSKYITVSYKAKYKSEYNATLKKRITSNQVDFYEVIITQLDLNGTKLINAGY